MKEFRLMSWLDNELVFISWLYKYKNFLGSLKRKDFKEFSTKEKAVKQFEKETKIHYNGYI